MCAGGDIQGVDNRRAMRLAMDPHNQPKCKRQYCWPMHAFIAMHMMRLGYCTMRT
jgi:hypothetical protein